MDIKDAKFIVASGPVVVEDGKVLLNRHGDDEEARKYWKFIGGRVELLDIDFNPADVLEAVCKREVAEEMGLEIEIIVPLKPMMIKHPNKENTYVILIHYLAKRIGEVQPGPDIVDWNWFDINNLPENLAPNIRPVIESYQDLIRRKIINI